MIFIEGICIHYLNYAPEKTPQRLLLYCSVIIIKMAKQPTKKERIAFEDVSFNLKKPTISGMALTQVKLSHLDLNDEKYSEAHERVLKWFKEKGIKRELCENLKEELALKKKACVLG